MSCKRVFRLRGLPLNINREDVASLVSQCLGDMQPQNIHVYSLATSLLFGGKPLSMMATVMFDTMPARLQNYQIEYEWEISSQNSEWSLTLDHHFMGMTPLNDLDHLSHKFDCIAISGLSSHPFGSWQPRSTDKTFMWIRDALPKHVPGIRTILYGYETNLLKSQSFENITDLSKRLIDLLTTYGWDTQLAKPVCFLAHSLGGLVLRDALQQLSSHQSEAYDNLLQNIRGSVYFGVPNWGMKQESFRQIVKDRPNNSLIEDIGRGSDYLRELNRNLSKSAACQHLKQFWAYETLESPTVIKTSDGSISRDGPPVVLVSRDSATLGQTEPNDFTFPIKANHSDMVKFGRESPDYEIVVSKLRKIMEDGSTKPRNYSEYPSTNDQSLSPHLNQRHFHSSSVIRDEPQGASLEKFKRISGITQHEDENFRPINFEAVKNITRKIQTDQEQNQNLLYMQRLQPFMMSMKEFGEVSDSHKKSFGVAYNMSYVWGPMERIIRVTSTSLEAFNSILDAYQEIGENIPRLHSHRAQLASNEHFRSILSLIFDDTLWFHREILRILKQPEWNVLFRSSWADFASSLDQIKERLDQSRRLIDAGSITFKDLEEILNIRWNSARTFNEYKEFRNISRRDHAIQWLAPANVEAEHARHRKTRSICQFPGKWLLQDTYFRRWLDPESSTDPSIWLTGKPGAGKTILASIVIDEVKKISNATVLYFYCKHGDSARNSFISAARSILSQLLNQNHRFIPYFFEKASTTGGSALLQSDEIAQEMIRVAMITLERTYIIIDGLDECGHDERVEMTKIFLNMMETVQSEVSGIARCFFTSQDDGMACRHFRGVPTIRIAEQNKDDIEDFAQKRHLQIETYKLKPRMFIFADLFAKFLESQLNKAALLAELEPGKLPDDMTLNHVYERILGRIFKSQSAHNKLLLKKVLGWITCALRPLRWAEIQGAVCIDVEQEVIFDHKRKFLDDPKSLFASLIEILEDDTVGLVHETARKYLRHNVIDVRQANSSLAIKSLEYLTFPELDENALDSDSNIQRDLQRGIYSFHDYASACWAMHLKEGVSKLEIGAELAQLLEITETFIERHWSSTHQALKDTKKVQKALESMETSESFDRIVQAVSWANRQSSDHGRGPHPDEALDLSSITSRIRSVLEEMVHSRPTNEGKEVLQSFYGSRLFKCPRVNCIYYYQGFDTFAKREHHLNKHNRPFLCYFSGCQYEVSGHATEKELKAHLFKYHGVDLSDDKPDDEFPDPPKPKQTSTGSSATFKCEHCNKEFTRRHTLQTHLRSHSGEKPYTCSLCGKSFSKKGDCDRHERTHEGKKFLCLGELKNGEKWSCRKAYSRQDKLAEHFRKKGKNCIKPYLEERQRELGDDQDNGGNVKLFDGLLGENADTLHSIEKLLPGFQQFMEMCGLLDVPDEAKVEEISEGDAT
ncbi:hypothetical protein F5Y16DRAFT_416784 [Xylariaceae sp. FL0255]|nr:hypothetical protein F5Y16DRAFT_416784 [Xylariaceae sp. FL0255]